MKEQRDITEWDALAAGCSAQRLRELLEPLADKCDVKPLHWIIGDESGEEYCLDCAEKKSPGDVERGTEGAIDGGWSWESDGFCSCGECGAVLECTYTEEGAERELNHFLDDIDGDAIRYPGDAWSMMRCIASHDDQPEWAGRLALLCYRQLHPRPWWRRRWRRWLRRWRWRAWWWFNKGATRGE